MSSQNPPASPPKCWDYKCTLSHLVHDVFEESYDEDRWRVKEVKGRGKELGVVAHTFNPSLGRQR